MPRRMIYDRWLFLTTGLLVVGGLFMVGSASRHVAMDYGMDPSALWWKHAVHLVLGFFALLTMLSIPYRQLADGRVVKWLVVGSFVLLTIVLAMPEMGGARRWIPVGPFHLQPSEFAKLVAVLFMAYVLSRKEESVNDPWSVPLPCLIVVGTMAFLIVIEPDLGSAAMPVAVAGVMIFAAGLRWRYLISFGAIASFVFSAFVLAEPWRRARITAFIDPWGDRHASGYQLIQSMVALGNGGVTGVGLGNSNQKALYLPAAHTDFIFSVIGEELGLVGCGVLLVAFLLLFWRGLRTALRAPDRFGFYLALGITNLLVLQALINMAICTGLLPTKGLPLPFISYGGSSLLASMTAVGLLLNVSQHSD